MISACEIDKLPQGYYTHTGTVLKRRDSSKAGQSLLLFMRDLGPRWVSAPAASSKNRFGGATEPLVWSEYGLYQSPQVLYLKSAEVKEDFISLREDARKLSMALGFYKRVSSVVLTGVECNTQLKVLWNAMSLLKDGARAEAVEFRFTWRLLSALGVAPSLRSCVTCSSQFDDGAAWTRDGLACQRCSGPAVETVSQAELRDIQCAALLPYENFLSWAKGQDNVEVFQRDVKKLVTFFGEIR